MTNVTYPPPPQQPDPYNQAPGYPTTAVPYAPPPGKKKGGATKALLIIVAVCLVLCGGLIALGAAVGNKPKPAAVASPAATVAGAPAGPTTAAAPAAPPTSAKPAAPPPPPAAPTIDDGTWTVGQDFPAGTYRTVGASADCYWSITKSGSNGSDIVTNHIGAGNLTVTLKVGQDFETERCGIWKKA